MRIVDNDAIKAHGAVRCRSEYHYAVFEYWRSAKVLKYLEYTGLQRFGHVLDDGCGGGGMCVSLAQESDLVVGIDLENRFQEAGTVLAREQTIDNVRFAQCNAERLPFRDVSFDLVLSHSVIEHVADPLRYLREARRVLKPNGWLFLETAPYLSPSGAHLPRLKVPIPLHLLIGRRAAFALTRWLGQHQPQLLDVPPESCSFVTMARRGETKINDLRYHVTLESLRDHIDHAGLRLVREDLHISRLARRKLPSSALRLLRKLPVSRDIIITNMEYLLTRT